MDSYLSKTINFNFIKTQSTFFYFSKEESQLGFVVNQNMSEARIFEENDVKAVKTISNAPKILDIFNCAFPHSL